MLNLNWKQGWCLPNYFLFSIKTEIKKKISHLKIFNENYYHHLTKKIIRQIKLNDNRFFLFRKMHCFHLILLTLRLKKDIFILLSRCHILNFKKTIHFFNFFNVRYRNLIIVILVQVLHNLASFKIIKKKNHFPLIINFYSIIFSTAFY